MRHCRRLRKLNRTSSHRKALLRNLCVSLLRHELIRTTLPKAKALRRVVEKIITLGKSLSDARYKKAFAELRDKQVVKKLFEVLGKRYSSRPGGYVRILKIGHRKGDAAPMALVELVDREEVSVSVPKIAAGSPMQELAS